MTHPRNSSDSNTATADPHPNAHDDAQGRLRQRVPVAVIDIGSNSVRQVIYEGLTRAPSVLFNEKVLCGLGRGLAQTGRLDDEAVERAVSAIRRFLALGRQAGVAKTFILATAAARDAVNGPQFVARVEELSGGQVQVLSGEKEAYYSALGIASGFFRPHGIAGDLGGGSLELVSVVGNGPGDLPNQPDGTTLPLGGLRLHDLADGSLKNARKIACEHLQGAQIAWPNGGKNGRRTFYAVGGTWRSLARLHMSAIGYPLAVIHHYSQPADEIIDFCDHLAEADLTDFAGIETVSRSRRNLLPYGAVVLAETLRALEAKKMTTSSLGVREGYLYTQLPASERRRDPLLEAAWDLAVLRARSPRHSRELADWTGEAFASLGVEESENEARYRIASCYLADIAWRAHPDYRATQSLGIISNAGFVGITHEGRAYLALANFHRYRGMSSKIEAPPIGALAGRRVSERARMLAALFRVLYLYSASLPGVLPQLALKPNGGPGSFVLNVPAKFQSLTGERPQLRLEQLAKEAQVSIELKVG